MVSARPITQFVLKVHSRCDLACDHCYVYEHADQSWRRRPAAIHPSVTRQTAVRIAEHVSTHRLSRVSVVLHGGEPLLLGVSGLRRVLAEFRDHVGALADLDLRIHTNGVRLSPLFCDLFAEFGVKIGVSLDGDAAANDRHRRFASGRSSHALVRSALELLRSPPYRRLYAGILCTVDLANDPVAVFDALLAEEPPRIDFLLPHATWDNPPPRPQGETTAYADWLARIFDTWTARGRPVPIRLFDSLETLAAGGPSQSEAVGLDPVDLLVVETDGEWEQVDSLKTAYDGAPATGFNVFAHSADEAAAHPAVAARRNGAASLSPDCQKCSVVGRCGGGLVAHRYRTGTGFRNTCSTSGSGRQRVQTQERGRRIRDRRGRTHARYCALGPEWGVVRRRQYRLASVRRPRTTSTRGLRCRGCGTAQSEYVAVECRRGGGRDRRQSGRRTYRPVDHDRIERRRKRRPPRSEAPVQRVPTAMDGALIVVGPEDAESDARQRQLVDRAERILGEVGAPSAESAWRVGGVVTSIDGFVQAMPALVAEAERRYLR